MSVQRFRAGEYVEVPIRDPQGKWVRWSDYEQLQSRLAQVEQERESERAGCKAANDLIVKLDNFRSRAIQLCKDKAAEWERDGALLRVETPKVKALAAKEIAIDLEQL